MQLNEAAYNQRVGRNLNFRDSDFSNLQNSYQTEEYLNRGQSRVRPFLKPKWPSVFITHELLEHMNWVWTLFPKMKWIELVRHPIDLIFSWMIRGLCRRYGNDPTMFTLVQESGVPLYVKEAEDYLRLQPIDQVIYSIGALYRQGLTGLKENHTLAQGRLKIVVYDEILSQPEVVIEDLGRFLDKQIAKSRLELILKNTGLPQWVDVQLREQHFEFLLKMNPAFRKSLDAMINDYEELSHYGKKN